MAKNQNNNVAPATQKTDPGAKKDALATALAQIEKQFGKGAVMKLGDNAAMQVDAISTGSIGLDLALGVGGVPRGRIIEVYGPESSGKTTLALHVLAEAQKKGGDVAFIDVEHALDPVYAEALGVDINNLLVSQPDTGEQAMEICEALVRSGAIDAIVVDSVAAMVPRAEIEGEMGDSHVGLQAHMAVAHLALDLGAGHHGGNRVHNDGINGTGAHQRLADLHGLLTGIGLADQQVVDVHTKRLGIHRVQRVLHIDEGNIAALLLGFGQNVQGQCGLTTGFGAVHLNDAAPGHAAHAQCQIQADASGRDGIHLHGGVIAQLHHCALAELLLDLGQCRGQRILLGTGIGLLGRRGNVVVLIFCHSVMLLCHLFPAQCGQTQARAFQFFRY